MYVDIVNRYICMYFIQRALNATYLCRYRYLSISDLYCLNSGPMVIVSFALLSYKLDTFFILLQ